MSTNTSCPVFSSPMRRERERGGEEGEGEGRKGGERGGGRGQGEREWGRERGSGAGREGVGQGWEGARGGEIGDICAEE